LQVYLAVAATKVYVISYPKVPNLGLGYACRLPDPPSPWITVQGVFFVRFV